ncbi:helix-turn-helix domain-containing protein [Asaia spathodeae]
MRDPILSDILSRKGAVKQMAAACKISHAAVSQWERVPKRHLHAVSREVGIPPETLRPDLFNSVAQRNAA